MKKILPIILCLVVAMTSFVACSKEAKEEESNTIVNEQGYTEYATDKAVVKNADAIKLIEGYSDEELGITKEDRENCSFMVASSGEKLEDKEFAGDYVKVIAAIKTEHKDEETGKSTFTFDTKGEYYISYDGKTIIKKNGETYEKLKVKEIPTTAEASDKE